MAALGTLHNGIGVSHLQSIMGAVEVPSLSVAEHSCIQAGIEEKILSELKGQSGESVSIDQGWQKRGAAMNSMRHCYSMTFIDDRRIIKESHKLRCAY